MKFSKQICIRNKNHFNKLTVEQKENIDTGRESGQIMAVIFKIEMIYSSTRVLD